MVYRVGHAPAQCLGRGIAWSALEMKAIFELEVSQNYKPGT